MDKWEELEDMHTSYGPRIFLAQGAFDRAYDLYCDPETRYQEKFECKQTKRNRPRNPCTNPACAPSTPMTSGPDATPNAPTLPPDTPIAELLELAGLGPRANFGADVIESLPRRYPDCPAGMELARQFYELRGRLVRWGNATYCPRGDTDRRGPGTLLLRWECRPQDTVYQRSDCWAGRYGSTIDRTEALALTAAEIDGLFADFPLLMRSSSFEPINPDPSFGDEIPW